MYVHEWMCDIDFVRSLNIQKHPIYPSVRCGLRTLYVCSKKNYDYRDKLAMTVRQCTSDSYMNGMYIESNGTYFGSKGYVPFYIPGIYRLGFKNKD